MLTVIDVSVRLSPVFIVTLLDNVIDMLNVPSDASVQKLMSVSTSGLVPAQFVHAGWLLALTLAADAAFHVTAGRVVVDETLDVPFGPGAPVCNWTKLLAGLVVSVVSIAFAVVVEMPSATTHLP
jgi:hypothetical protein